MFGFCQKNKQKNKKIQQKEKEKKKKQKATTHKNDINNNIGASFQAADILNPARVIVDIKLRERERERERDDKL